MSRINLSPETIAAVRKYGPAIDQMARKRYGISGAALLGKLVAGESHDSMSAVSGAGARGKTQFMDSSRHEAMRKYGIDPWHSTDEAVHGAELHLRGKINGSTGLEGYNPGDPTYKRYILSQKIGDVHSGGGAGSARVLPGRAGAPRTVTTVRPGRTREDVDSATLDALLAPHKPGQLSKDIIGRLDSGQYTTSTPSRTITRTVGGHGGGQTNSVVTSGAAGVGGRVGHLNFVSDQTGVKGDVHAFLHDITRVLGHGIDVGTGKVGHSKYVAGTNRVSDHASGDATDLPATGAKGDKIAYAAFRAAGVSEQHARQWAHEGGLHNIVHNGKRIQIIWKTMIGGNHFNHVHVGVKPLG